MGSVKQELDYFPTYPELPFKGHWGDCFRRLMVAGVCTVSEGLPREGSHSENLPFGYSRPVSRIPEQETKSVCGSDTEHLQSPLLPANPELEKMGMSHMSHIYLVARDRVPEAGIAGTSPDTRGWTS